MLLFWYIAGEVSLPGGKTEEGDKDDVETAMREAKEEIGLDSSLVNVVTILEPFLSKVLKSLCFNVTVCISLELNLVQWLAIEIGFSNND